MTSSTGPRLRPRLVPRLARWIDDRLGAAKGVRSALDKVFPDHWSFMLGEVALYCFIILIGTGVFLTFFYDPSTATVTYQGSHVPLQGLEVSRAYNSALDLSFDVRAGLVMRQAHHWAALLFLAATTAHMFRVWFTGAYRRPREINWIIGLVMMLLAIANGFMGYSLLDDQLSGSGLRIAYSIVLSIPVAGTWIASLVFGGEFPGADLLERFYVLHILILPALIAALVGIHMAILIRHKHTHFPGAGATDDNVVGERLWPTYLAKAVAMLFLTAALVFLLGGVAQINPIWIFGPYRPGDVSTASQPDWYMGWLDGTVRIFPNWEIRAFGFEIPNPFFSAVLFPGVLFGLLFLAPFIEARFTHDRREHHVLSRPRDHPVRTGLGVAALSLYLVLLGVASADVVANRFALTVNGVIWAGRIGIIVMPLVTGVIAYKLCRELAARDRPPPPTGDHERVEPAVPAPDVGRVPVGE